MKNLRKSMSVVLILLVSLFCLSTVAFASTSEQDGLKVELTTDKENYSLNEDIKINVTVTNTNDVTVENVKIDTLLPEEFTLKDRNKSTSSEAVDIPAGKKIEFSVVAVVKDGKSDKTSSDTDSSLIKKTDNNDSKVQAVQATDNKSDTNKKDTANKINGNDKSPYTGKDYAVMTGFSALFIIGIVLLILCLKRNRKKTSKAVSSALCLVLAVTSFIGLADFKAKADNKQSDTDTSSVISISDNISVNGKDYTITANINYVNALTQKWFKDIEENHIAKSNTGIEYIDNRIIVLFSSETTEEQKKNVIDRVNGKLIGNDNGSKYQIQIKTTENLEELKSICLEVSKMNGVLWCFYETVDKIAKGNELLQSVPNDPWKDTFQGIWGTDWNEEKPSGLNWWLETIQAPSAWDYSNRFNSVKIGVVDNGFDTNHEDLNINLINPNENSSDLHGTHVAGIIGATANNETGITGIVWNKELYCADVIATNKQNKNYVSILKKYDGIEETLEKGCKVVNLSMGAEEPIENNNDVLNCGATAAAYLLYWEQTIKRDFIIVQSAGNSGVDSTKNGNFASITDDSINYLFNNQESIWSESDVSLKEKYKKNDIYKHFVVVGAIEKDGNNYKLCDHSKNIVKELRWASCYGDYVSVVAPGKDIFSTINSGGINGNYGYLDGTSMAAPIVSGVTALVWSINPNFTANEVKHIVCNSYNKTANGYQQSDNRAYPIVNAKLAVEEAIRRTDNKGVATGAFIDSITKKHIKNVTMNCIKYTGTLNNYKLSDFNIKTIDGIFYKDLHEGTYEYKIKSDNYTLDETVIIVVKKGKTTDKGTIELIKIKNGITGYVYDNDNFINNAKDTPISDVIIEVYKDNNLIGKTTTDKNGKYSISIDKNGSYDLLFKKSGYNDEKKTLTDVDCETVVLTEPVLLKAKKDANIFNQIPKDFSFSSGAGGWGTDITINNDGTFTGEYHDSEGSNTVYICKFNGKFSTPTKVNEYTYSMDLEFLNTEGKVNDYYYENGIKYIYSTPYGFDNANKFYIYLPGAPVANLPNEFLGWSFINTDIRKTLPNGFYGIYNFDGKEGFVGLQKDSIWVHDYKYSFNGYKSEFWPSYSTPSHLLFWPENGEASIDLYFDWSNDKQKEFVAYDENGSGTYKLIIDISDDFSTIKVSVLSNDKIDLSAWGGTQDGKLVAEYKKQD